MSGRPKRSGHDFVIGRTEDGRSLVLNTDRLDRAVTFRLDGQLYGVPLEVVREIQHFVEPMSLPDADPHLLGLIDLRGLVVPAVDLRGLMGLKPESFTLQTSMVFCRVREHMIALVVDSVEDVVDLSGEELQVPPATCSLPEKMLGIVRFSQGLLPVLDVEQLIPDTAFCAAEGAKGGNQ